MMGIATVASPDDDGMRNESGMNSPNIRLMNAMPPRPATACSAQNSTVSVIWPLFMITEMPRATPMMSATPSRSRAPFTKESVKAPFYARQHADDDGEEQERRGHLREPPSGWRSGDAQVRPRDDAHHHRDEGEEERHQDRLVATRQRPPAATASPGASSTDGSASPRPTGAFTREERRARVRPDASGIAHHPPDADGEARDEDDDPADEPIHDGGARNPDAIPVANGLMVDSSTPIPHPSRSNAAATVGRSRLRP